MIAQHISLFTDRSTIGETSGWLFVISGLIPRFHIYNITGTLRADKRCPQMFGSRCPKAPRGIFDPQRAGTLVFKTCTEHVCDSICRFIKLYSRSLCVLSCIMKVQKWVVNALVNELALQKFVYSMNDVQSLNTSDV